MRIFRLIALALLVLLPGTAGAQDGGRLFYQMIVTHPGSRSEGLFGQLFGADGTALEVAPGTAVVTHAGTFYFEPCTLPWQPCGFLHDGQEGGPLGMTDSLPWQFRLYVTGEGSRSEGWRGELWHGDTELPSAGAATIDTPLGHFEAQPEPQVPWGWHGWKPTAWDSPGRG